MPFKEIIPTIKEIFDDLEHPNPNINRVAFLNMKEYWPKESIAILMRNLDCEDVELRRRSVKALGSFGTSIVKDIIQKYLFSKDKIFKVSCLKVLVIVASRNTLDNFKGELKILIDSAVKDQSAEVILTIISFLRQNGEDSIPYLKALCRDENVLKAKAAITAISEMNEISIGSFLESLIDDDSLDSLVRESAYLALNFNR